MSPIPILQGLIIAYFHSHSSSMGGSVPLITSDAVQLTEEEQQSIRAAIIMSKLPLSHIDIGWIIMT